MNTMMDTVATGCVEDCLQRSQVAHHFSVNPKLKEGKNSEKRLFSEVVVDIVFYKTSGVPGRCS
jgi:hypothetical protein